MKKFFLIVNFLLVIATAALVQSAGINGTGPQPNASAIPDVSSAPKGLLLPRMTAVQRTAIQNPATRLHEYQIDGTAGFFILT